MSLPWKYAAGCRTAGQKAVPVYEALRHPKAVGMRTTYVSRLQESPTKSSDEAPERPIVVCRDCRSPSPIEALIEVDTLHVQCPLCLFVFFLNRE